MRGLLSFLSMLPSFQANPFLCQISGIIYLTTPNQPILELLKVLRAKAQLKAFG